MLAEVAEGVFVRQSRFCLSNATVITSDGRALLVDPGIDGTDLDDLADDVAALDVAVVAGFATHPHWDHVLWHRRFGLDVPRYATTTCAATARQRLTALRDMTATQAPGAPLDLVGGLSPLPEPAEGVPWDGPGVRVVEHRGHAPGHAAIVVAGADLLVAGDMLSDVEIPLLDPRSADPAGDYLAGLDRLESAASDAVAVVPGHGSVAYGDDISKRFAADRSYVTALQHGVDPADPRVGPQAGYGTDWLPEAHERNTRLARGGS